MKAYSSPKYQHLTDHAKGKVFEHRLFKSPHSSPLSSPYAFFWQSFKHEDLIKGKIDGKIHGLKRIHNR